MLPSEEVFSNEISELGIDNNNHLIIYDNEGAASSSRVYFTFKVFGHENISILDGKIKTNNIRRVTPI
jgi:thiosulfate/3-mercaptopyruvate sulfurtransferase